MMLVFATSTIWGSIGRGVEREEVFEAIKLGGCSVDLSRGTWVPEAIKPGTCAGCQGQVLT